MSNFNIRSLNTVCVILLMLNLSGCADNQSTPSHPPVPGGTFWEAVQNEDWGLVERWIEYDAQLIHSRGVFIEKDGNRVIQATPILVAVKYSDADADTIRFLIKNGADVNTKDELGISLTHLAVKNCLESDDSDYQGNIKILAALIEHGADINSCDENGLPPLAYTINSRKFELIKFLLENGADIRINKHLGTHLLCEAVEHRKIDIVERLIDKGVNVNSDVLDGCPLLIWSIYNNLTDSLISLIIEKGAEIDSRDSSNKRTPLHYAVAYDRYTVIKQLLERKADVSARGSDGLTPLMLSVKKLSSGDKNAADTFRLLKQSGADINDKHPGGMTILSTTIHDGDFDVAEFLIKQNADINACNDDGSTPLIQSLIGNKNIKFLRFMIENGADVNMHDKANGSSPLHYAVNIGDVEMLECVCEKARNIDSKNNDGLTPLCLVYSKWLMEKTDIDHKSMFGLLVTKGADINQTYDNGDPILLDAVKRKKMDIVQYVVSLDADINIADGDGLTFLVASIQSLKNSAEKSTFIKFLIDKGIDPKQKDANNRTPLHHAVEKEDIETVKLLLGNGANKDVKDNDGITPLGIACLNNRKDIIELMVGKEVAYQKTLNLFECKGTGSRFVFVVDQSASMSEYGGRAFRAIKKKLVDSISVFDDGDCFNIIFYNDKFQSWNKNQLAIATDINKKNAKEYIAGVAPSGGTRHADPLLAAIKHKSDVIFFLTDGDANDALSPSQLKQITETNKSHGNNCPIHVVQFGVGANRQADDLRKLASQNHGQYTYVDIAKLP